MQEIWKPVVGFEEYLEISNLGRLKRKIIYKNNWRKGKSKIKVDRIIKPTNDRGYSKVKLSIDGKNYLKYVHRIVAEAFIPNPNNYKEVNHKDNNPSNNCVDNLEWCDRKYNIDYMVKHQEQIKDRHERRIETLETIFYGIEFGYINNVNQVKKLIDENLLNEY